MAVFLMSTCLAVPTPEPSPSPLCCCCSRSLFTILWGFAFAFGGLTLDAWHTADAHDQRAASFRRKLYYVVFFGPVALFTNLLALFYDLGAHRLLSKSLNNMPDNMPDNMPGRERELAKKAAKIIANCKVVLGTSEGKLPQRHGTQLQADITDQEHPLVLGSRLPENSYMVQLNRQGKEALLRSGVLPGYRRLQLLQGNRSFAVVLYGMQAFGYMAVAIVRGNMGLVVSPVETIGFTFSTLVVMHSVCHFVVAPCHRPLIVYLRPDQEQDNVFQMCQSTQSSPVGFRLALAVSGLVSSAVGIFILMQPSRRSPGTPSVNCITAQNSSRGLLFISAGPRLFTWSAYFHLFRYLCSGSWIWILIIECIHRVGTVSGIIIALVATIVYWDENFAERTEGTLHILPFIG
jgi:hypothetical protein